VLAILSDIHGNRPALEAVLDAVQALGITRVLVLGDVIGNGDRTRGQAVPLEC